MANNSSERQIPNACIRLTPKPKCVELYLEEWGEGVTQNFDFPAETLVFLDGGPPNSVNTVLWVICACMSNIKWITLIEVGRCELCTNFVPRSWP